MINWVVAAVIAGFTSFVATNIDDLVILIVFFSQINKSFRVRHILVGHTIAFIALILASLPGFFGGLFLPEEGIGLLGILPIAIGIRQLFQSADDSDAVQTVSHELEHELDAVHSRGTRRSVLASVLVPQTYHVAVITFANGGDNIGVYVPLFASSDLPSLLIIISLFLVLSLVWCFIAYYITRHPILAPVVTRYGNRLVPFVLIGLGLYILIENGTYRLLPAFQV
ncbi:cadmium resistance transporter [Egbenema bharatensis]|uniref:cadmium resistance transporter n=1 Tax=Egbenema bharatensis TaxID=3463334 RepID=UPI003A8B980A